MQPVMVIGYHKSVCNVRPDNIRLLETSISDKAYLYELGSFRNDPTD